MTELPSLNCAEQCVAQLVIPGGELVTVPWPEPFVVVTERVLWLVPVVPSRR